MDQKIIFVVGPTAVGKSEIAYQLALKLGGEIVSCDSMQVYKEINIASNKPSSEELSKVKHHLVNIISIKDEFNVAQFYQLATKAIKKIHDSKRAAIVVGGSGLYMQILLDGIFEGDSHSKRIRQNLEEELKLNGNEDLYKRLKQCDPIAASKIHPNDPRRIIRALEVFESEDKALSELQKNRQGLWGKYDITIFGLNRQRNDLYERINTRVDCMVAQGLVEEIKTVSQLPLSQSAGQTIGMKEIHAYLNNEYNLDRACELIKRNSRRYAKRQMTWFRKEKRLTWLEIDNQTPLQVMNRMLKEMEKHGIKNT